MKLFSFSNTGRTAALAMALGFTAIAHAAPPAGTAQVKAVADDAPAQNLRVTHHVLSIGDDGVQREMRYAQRLYRRPGMVWTEREMPAALARRHAHGAHETRAAHIGHAHADVAGAPLWVQRGADGKVQVILVLREQKKLIEADAASYGNVGYNGSWADSYWLANPERLRHMQRVGPQRVGVQRYQRREADGSLLRIDWDAAGQYPRRIERRDAHGTSVNLLSAASVAAPATLPWQTLKDYARGDYSDLLD